MNLLRLVRQATRTNRYVFFIKEPYGLTAWVPGFEAKRVHLNIKRSCKGSQDHARVKSKIPPSTSPEVRAFWALAKKAKESYSKRANENNFGTW